MISGNSFRNNSYRRTEVNNLEKMITLGEINAMAAEPEKFVEECTARYRDFVTDCAKKIFTDQNKKIVMLAGPSSSGKTTSAHVLSGVIEKMGGTAYTVSLDDFYLSHDEEPYPLNDEGEQDYECVEALNIPLIKKCLKELIDDNESALPVFDFATGKRTDGVNKIVLDDNDIIIIEGLHALNPVITDGLDPANIFKIYVSVRTRVYDDEGNIVLSRRDMRFIRRSVRDYFSRSMPVERTFEIWDNVAEGENKYLFPFEDLADVDFDTFHFCEPCILAEAAIKLLSEVEDGEFKAKADSLVKSLRCFKTVEPGILPADSVLNEFVSR